MSKKRYLKKTFAERLDDIGCWLRIILFPPAWIIIAVMKIRERRKAARIRREVGW
jgi:hypothetical protein